MRQIALAGFLGVYAGCMPLTINMARLPYWRGAIIGVFFGALTHMLATLVYVLLIIFASEIMNDVRLQAAETWGFIILGLLVIQSISSIGCLIMGAYFHAPKKGSIPFDRPRLLESLKRKEIKINPPESTMIRKSVLHDVVVCLENYPASNDRRFSWLWILLFGLLSIASSLIWINTLFWSCIDAIFYGIPVDIHWYLNIVLNSLLPLIVLILTHFSTLGWLCRDLPKRKTENSALHIAN